VPPLTAAVNTLDVDITKITGGGGEIVTERYTAAFEVIVSMPTETTIKRMIPKTLLFNACPLPVSYMRIAEY
jgi:hypothetical protein